MVLNNKIKLIDKKKFNFQRDRIIRYLYDKGTNFLSLKIDCTAEWLSLVEGLTCFEKVKKKFYWLIETELPGIQLVDFFSISVVETFKKGPDGDNSSYTIYALVGYRSLFEYNEALISNLKDRIFMLEEHLVDLSYLTSLNEIINFWTLMANNFVWSNDNVREGLLFISYFQRKDEVIYGHMADFFSCILPFSKFSPQVGFYENHPDAHIDGLNFRIIRDRSVILIHLIKVFMEENKMFINDGWIYQKDSKNLNFEQKVVSVENLFELTSSMSSFFSDRFPSQYSSNYFYNLIIEQADVCLRKIKTVPSLLPTKIKEISPVLSN